MSRDWLRDRLRAGLPGGGVVQVSGQQDGFQDGRQHGERVRLTCDTETQVNSATL